MSSVFPIFFFFPSLPLSLRYPGAVSAVIPLLWRQPIVNPVVTAMLCPWRGVLATGFTLITG